MLCWATTVCGNYCMINTLALGNRSLILISFSVCNCNTTKFSYNDITIANVQMLNFLRICQCEIFNTWEHTWYYSTQNKWLDGMNTNTLTVVAVWILSILLSREKQSLLSLDQSQPLVGIFQRIVCVPQSAGPDVAAIRVCCLAPGPLMKEPFSRGEGRLHRNGASDCAAPRAGFRVTGIWMKG